MGDVEVRLDLSRKDRKGFPEVIFCQGKSDERLCLFVT